MQTLGEIAGQNLNERFNRAFRCTKIVKDDVGLIRTLDFVKHFLKKRHIFSTRRLSGAQSFCMNRIDFRKRFAKPLPVFRKGIRKKRVLKNRHRGKFFLVKKCLQSRCLSETGRGFQNCQRIRFDVFESVLQFLRK